MSLDYVMNNGEKEKDMPMDLYLIHDGTLDLQSLSGQAPEQSLTGLLWDQRETPPVNARVLLYLGDEKVHELAPLVIEKQWELGLLPHPEASQTVRALGVKGNLHDIYNHYLQVDATEADVLTCNDQLVFSSVIIGEALSIKPHEPSTPQITGSRLIDAIMSIRELRLKSYTLTTGKEQKMHIGALGMLVMEHTQSTMIGRFFSEALSITDGRLTLLVLAPRSVFAYLWFLVQLFLPKRISLSRLPEAVGMIRSTRILLESSRGIDYSLDGRPLSAKSIEFRILDQSMNLLPGPALKPAEDKFQDKDTVKLGHVPVGETARQLVEAPLPFFNHASEDEYRDLFVSLRESATLSSQYVVLMVLSVLLALTGLYANSAPVIIGAMILAPLMSPIVSLAMGLARTHPSLVRNSLQTLFIGIGVGLFCAISVAWLMPLQNLTTEMQARLSPTLLDLSVAIISGIAGAYAYAKEEVAKSLAGVAIAVALVPPLSVAGIGVGWGDWTMARGAFLLLFTNLVGISLAASVTFLVMGFAPFRFARKGLTITLLLMGIIIGPLYIAFADLIDQGRIVKSIPTGEIMLSSQSVDLRIIDVRAGSPPLVKVVLSSSRRLDESHVDELKYLIRGLIGQDFVLQAQMNLRR
jgi:uncharacterized hydrophobic protein (TIGR00271 family)